MCQRQCEPRGIRVPLVARIRHCRPRRSSTPDTSLAHSRTCRPRPSVGASTGAPPHIHSSRAACKFVKGPHARTRTILLAFSLWRTRGERLNRPAHTQTRARGLALVLLAVVNTSFHTLRAERAAATLRRGLYMHTRVRLAKKAHRHVALFLSLSAVCVRCG